MSHSNLTTAATLLSLFSLAACGAINNYPAPQTAPFEKNAYCLRYNDWNAVVIDPDKMSNKTLFSPTGWFTQTTDGFVNEVKPQSEYDGFKSMHVNLRDKTCTVHFDGTYQPVYPLTEDLTVR